MSISPHPRAELSAYHDDALAPAERSAVDSHLATCDDCRARLAELRSVASLIGALPELRPSRRLLPRVSAAPAWLAPLRTLTSIASGVSVFLFIASALLTNVSELAATGTSALAPAAAPAAGGAPERGAAGSPTQNAVPGAAADAATKSQPSPTAGPTRQFAISTTPPQDAAARADQSAQRETLRSATDRLGPSPWLWLALALVLAAIAIALQRRLRSA